MAVVTFESNLNDESKSSCWSLLAREKKSRRCVEKKRVVAENGQPQQTTNDFGGNVVKPTWSGGSPGAKGWMSVGRKLTWRSL